MSEAAARLEHMTDPALPTPASPRPLRSAVAEWVEGWTASRGVAAVERAGSWRVPFGHPDRWAEFVVPLDDEARSVRDERLAAVLAEAAEVGSLGDRVWVSVVTHDAADVAAAGARAGFEVRSAEESFMGVDLAGHAARRVPAPYELDVAEAGAAAGRVPSAAPPGPVPVLRASAWVGEGHEGEGDDAATGRAAITSAGACVLDRVETDDAHRRRGLGGAVVHALVDEARRRGATRGLLVASTDGAGLYESLGWTRLASVVVLVTAPAS